METTPVGSTDAADPHKNQGRVLVHNSLLLQDVCPSNQVIIYFQHSKYRGILQLHRGGLIYQRRRLGLIAIAFELTRLPRGKQKYWIQGPSRVGKIGLDIP